MDLYISNSVLTYEQATEIERVKPKAFTENFYVYRRRDENFRTPYVTLNIVHNGAFVHTDFKSSKITMVDADTLTFYLKDRLTYRYSLFVNNKLVKAYQHDVVAYNHNCYAFKENLLSSYEFYMNGVLITDKASDVEIFNENSYAYQRVGGAYVLCINGNIVSDILADYEVIDAKKGIYRCQDQDGNWQSFVENYVTPPTAS